MQIPEAHPDKRLGEILVEHGWTKPETVNAALSEPLGRDGRLGTRLLELGAVSEEHLAAALAEQTGFPPADTESLRHVPSEVVNRLDQDVARRCRAVPFALCGNDLHVAMADADDWTALLEIAFTSGYDVCPHVGCEARISTCLHRYYGLDCPSRHRQIVHRLDQRHDAWERAAKIVRRADGTFEVAWQHPDDDTAPALQEPHHAELIRFTLDEVDRLFDGFESPKN